MYSDIVCILLINEITQLQYQSYETTAFACASLAKSFWDRYPKIFSLEVATFLGMFKLEDRLVKTVTPKPEGWQLCFEYFIEEAFKDIGYTVSVVVIESRSRLFDSSSFKGMKFPIRNQMTSQGVKIQGFRSAFEKYAKMATKASPVESMNPGKLPCFSSPKFMSPINPFCVSTSLQYTASNTLGHRSPCRVHLPGAYVSTTFYNDMLLPELDFLVSGRTGRIKKLHIVFGNEDPTLGFLKELKVSMIHLEKFSSDTEPVLAYDAWGWNLLAEACPVCKCEDKVSADDPVRRHGQDLSYILSYQALIEGSEQFYAVRQNIVVHLQPPSNLGAAIPAQTPRHVWPDYFYRTVKVPVSAPGSDLSGKKRRKYAARLRKTESLREAKACLYKQM
ncbi:unnamed protein product [Allacma fusca]|uniref:Uncharacterized protein n=1 Tax=Allacma fusca TaxID=39272 RepID=A0A8J2PM63_9HEXA|nr:unnamed protein product [Allacma fusca]